MKNSGSGMLPLAGSETFLLATHPKAATRGHPGSPAISCEKPVAPPPLHSAPSETHLRVTLSDNNPDCEPLSAKWSSVDISNLLSNLLGEAFTHDLALLSMQRSRSFLQLTEINEYANERYSRNVSILRIKEQRLYIVTILRPRDGT